MEGDAGHYWTDGSRMASGDWLLAQGEVETIRTPGYPLFLALCQVVFGRHALIAATVCQQFMVFATAMVSAWICARISGTWLGGLCGLALGLFCVSQNAVADYLLSDTLFALLLTLAVAALIAWFERPAATAGDRRRFAVGAGHARASDRTVRLGADPLGDGVSAGRNGSETARGCWPMVRAFSAYSRPSSHPGMLGTITAADRHSCRRLPA